MPVTEKTVTSIVCDNPSCPGTELKKSSREGWTFIQSEVYGQQTVQHVYCCAACAGQLVAELEAAEPVAAPNA